MKNQHFKEEVVRCKIQFRSSIACVLDISQKLTETGKAVYTFYAVLTVTATLRGAPWTKPAQAGITDFREPISNFF
ncbi:hypothetical protein [Rufibacter tibetensis]|uniref:Uncharacterized protein n=1 Tax=Rufibacter tibetensis TaxID=512763 RepID=A0A0N7HW89_9BACT|nr:hypothetical protein [Rufibacter tibetensis]ALI98576.1 hypothetical protein DC20_05825 [Rufibacter tibetensis]